IFEAKDKAGELAASHSEFRAGHDIKTPQVQRAWRAIGVEAFDWRIGRRSPDVRKRRRARLPAHFDGARRSLDINPQPHEENGAGREFDLVACRKCRANFAWPGGVRWRKIERAQTEKRRVFHRLEFDL